MVCVVYFIQQPVKNAHDVFNLRSISNMFTKMKGKIGNRVEMSSLNFRISRNPDNSINT